jgi:hypothetical protein
MADVLLVVAGIAIAIAVIAAVAFIRFIRKPASGR